jgi:hypothetical protein
MTAAHTHACSATGCQKQVPWNIAMCMAHWRLVPPHIQRRVYKAWHALLRWPLETEEMAEHEAAIKEAVAAVEKKQFRKIAEKVKAEGQLFE